MGANILLELNDDQTELILITTAVNANHNQHIAINTEDILFTPREEPISNLRDLFESKCNLNEHGS